MMSTRISRWTGTNTARLRTQIAHDLVRLAANQEGIEVWLARHGGSIAAPSCATRQIADDLFGDSEDAMEFNAAMTFELDRHRRTSLHKHVA